MVDQSLIPGFASPLIDEQHAQLGRIAVLWGHCDMLLDEILSRVHRLTHAQRKAFIGEKPIGPKLEFLKPKIKGIRDAALREDIRKFYDILNNTKAKRNHIFHGAWGWRNMNREGDVRICARHPKAPANPVFAEDLPELEKELCKASRAGKTALDRYLKTGPHAGAAMFLHGAGRTAPKWFLQWLEQCPLHDSNLDRSWKEGQLPRPTFPVK